jgi:hypothetical protein
MRMRVKRTPWIRRPAFDPAGATPDDQRMGGPAMAHHEPGERRLAAIAWALGVGLAGCRDPVSLDERDPAATSTTGSTGASSHGSIDGSSSSGSSVPPDVPLGDLPGPPVVPGACPEGCVVDLPLAWAWDDELRPPPVERRLAAMVRTLDGAFVVADDRDGESWLTQVDRDGALVWSMPAQLSFDCEIVDMVVHPSGVISVIAEGFDGAFPLLVLAVLFTDSENLVELSGLYLAGTEDRPGQVGSLIPIDGFSQYDVVVLVRETVPARDGLEFDLIKALYFTSGFLKNSSVIDMQLASAPPWRPSGTRLPSGEIAMTLPGSEGTGDYMAWLDAPSLFPLGTEALPGPADVVTSTPTGAVVVAGHTPSRASLELQAMQLPRLQPPAWLFSAGVPTTTASAPVLAVDTLGSAYLAVRTTAGTPDAPGEAAVALLRVAADGTPVWSTTLPLAAEASPAPVALSLAADDQSLVLAAIVDGSLHLEQHEQGCRCD